LLLCLISSVDNFALKTLVGIGRASLTALPEHRIGNVSLMTNSP